MSSNQTLFDLNRTEPYLASNISANLVEMSGTVVFLLPFWQKFRCIFVNQIVSESTGSLCGIPQGSVLGPILFLLCVLPFGQIIQQFKQWLSDNYLQLNSDKTQNLIIAPRQCLGNVVFIFDKAMSLEHHSKQLIRNSVFQLRDILRLRLMVSVGEMIIHAFVSSRLDSRNSLFTCLNKKQLARLQVVQNSVLVLTFRVGRLLLTLLTCYNHIFPPAV